MKPSVFSNRVFHNQSMEQFMEMVYSSQMTYWASDLLSKGLPPHEISEAVGKAIVACATSGLDYHRHFHLMYTTSVQGISFDDCKMTKIGYRLTMLNANPSNLYVARAQMDMVQRP